MDIEKLVKNYLPQDQEKIREAFLFADNAHKGQKRASGDDYITHPFKTAEKLVSMNMDADSVCAGLLHDVVDDTDVSLDEIREKFGDEIAFMVESVTKLGKIQYRGVERQVENLRKMFLAMGYDVRVIIIKLADRWHNMTTLRYLPEPKQKRIALETLEIYAPIANRFSMGEIKGELEDLSFPYIYPDEYKNLISQVTDDYQKRLDYLEKIQPEVKKMLKDAGIKVVTIQTRAKHYYSLYQKLQRYDFDLNKIYDLVAIRIIVDEMRDCYAVLGAIHNKYQPLPGRIKDYIARPKPNGYQSLHTTVIGDEGRIIEFQIRTVKMHEHADFGIAAHWFYSESKKPKIGAVVGKNFEWVNQLKEWQKSISNSEDFLEALKIDFFNDRIFVYSPAGDVIDLPLGAAPLDFAYTIHSQIGNRCIGAKVNGKMASLDYELSNGDVVEILTQKKENPSRQWLNFVKTQKAKGYIKKWFKQQNVEQKIILGKEILSEKIELVKSIKLSDLELNKYSYVLDKLRLNSWNTLFSTIGEGEIKVEKVLKLLFPADVKEEPKTFKDIQSKMSANGTQGVIVAGQERLMTQMAKCCNPLPGDEILAYITKTTGATVHKKDCYNIRKLTKTDKVMPATWSETSKDNGYLASLKINAYNRVGLVKDISSAISDLNLNIASLYSSDPDANGEVNILVKIRFDNLVNFDRLILRLNNIGSIAKIEKV